MRRRRVGYAVRRNGLYLSPCKVLKTRMWADTQRDGRPAECRWRPLRKFRNSIPCAMPQSLTGRPLIGCRAVTLPV